MITRFDPTAHPQNRSLSEILDLTVLVPNDHRVARIEDRYVESAGRLDIQIKASSDPRF